MASATLVRVRPSGDGRAIGITPYRYSAPVLTGPKSFGRALKERGDPMLDYDPAASSFPPIRHQTDGRAIDSSVASDNAADRWPGSIIGQASTVARHALLMTLMALERHDPIEVRAVLGGILAGMPTADVLAALEAMAAGPSGHRLSAPR